MIKKLSNWLTKKDTCHICKEEIRGRGIVSNSLRGVWCMSCINSCQKSYESSVFYLALPNGGISFEQIDFPKDLYYKV